MNLHTHSVLAKSTLYTDTQPTQTYNHNHKNSGQLPDGSTSIIFFPSSCILGMPFAAMATSQYTLSVFTVAFFHKCSTRVYILQGLHPHHLHFQWLSNIYRNHSLMFQFQQTQLWVSNFISRSGETENGEAAGN